MHAGEVHRWAGEILAFWLEQTPPERRFIRDPALDGEIFERFAAVREAVIQSQARAWMSDPDITLAAIILLDQFSRNMFRDRAEAFAADPIARKLARHAIDRGWDQRMPPEKRLFLYLPFMHSEDSADQALSVSLFTALGDDEQRKHALAHAQRIKSFGRFPHRNAALGRVSTAAEIDFLSRSDSAY